jgi:hypothetical protein
MQRKVGIALAVIAMTVTMLGACGGKTGVYKHDYAGSITLTLVNASPRPIESVFIHPVTHPDRGASWTSTLAPGASTSIQITEGHFELIAVSQERRIDAKSRETPEAMTMLEIRADQKLVFHDVGQTVPGLDAASTLGVTFQITAAPAGDGGEPTTEATEPTPAAP